MGLFQERMSGGREKETDRMSMVEDIHGLKTNLSLSLFRASTREREMYEKKCFYMVYYRNIYLY